MNGSYQFASNPHIDLSLSAENVPMQYLALMARHAKRDLPSDMNMSGMLSAVLTVRGDYGNRVWAGSGQVSDVEIRSSVLTKPVVIASSRWSLVGPGTEVALPAKPAGKKTTKAKEELPPPTGLAWKVEPVSLKLGENAPATLAGWFAHDDYYTELRGEADLERLFELAKLAGLPKPASEVTGSAKGAVQISGEWAGFVPATITGEAQLKNIVAKFNGVASPMRIGSAHFVATKDAFSMNKATGSFAGVHSALEFSALWPQHCTTAQGADPMTCSLQFNVTADDLKVEEINALLNPKAQKRPWYAALMEPQRTKFPEVYANGQVNAAKLMMKNVTATHFSSRLSISPNGFALTSMSADVFGGKYTGQLTSDFSLGKPVYHATGKLQQVAMPSIAALMKDPWAAGVATVNVEGQASGWNADEIVSSAFGEADFDWRDGAMPHVALEADGKPLHFKSFTGALQMRNGMFSLSESKLQTTSGIYQVTGTASLDRRLEVKLSRDGTHPGYTVTGTLEHPTVAAARPAATRAKLARTSNR